MSPKNIPGYGDPETWPPCANHPSDPRTPEDGDTLDGLTEAELRAYESGHQAGYELGYDDGYRDAEKDYRKAMEDRYGAGT